MRRLVGLDVQADDEAVTLAALDGLGPRLPAQACRTPVPETSASRSELLLEKGRPERMAAALAAAAANTQGQAKDRSCGPTAAAPW